MLRSLLPASLALLLAPSLALAAPDVPVGGGSSDEVRSAAPASARSAPDRAERSGKRKSTGKRSGDKSGDKGSGEKSDGGDSRTPRPAPAPRDGGGDGGDSRTPRPAPRDSGAEGSRDAEPARGADGDARRPAPARPAPADADGGRGAEPSYARPDPRPGSGAEPARGGLDGARPAPGVDGARPAPGAEPARGGLDGARPASAEPTVRKVSVGAPTRAGVPSSAGAPANLGARQPDGPGLDARPASGNFRSPSPANFRSSAGRGDERIPAGRESHASSERHGDRGSDAERVTRGSHAASERHREEVRHARATAAYHRSSAHYRRSAAARHHAWATSRHHRYNRWYHPGGWFRPYRPGHAYWYHGVFVYGPSPWYHHHHHTVIVDGGGDGGGREERAQAEPVRKVDRNRSFAVGLRGGSYLGGYNFGGGGFGDAGLGLAVRYRPVEAVGFELSWMHHDQTWDDGSERINQPLQASVQLFGMPWTKVNPYVLAGVTVTGRDVQDLVPLRTAEGGFTTVSQSSTLFGPHAGLGIEFGLGQKASVNFDARYTGYLNKPEDDITVPGAFQGNMGLNFYF